MNPLPEFNLLRPTTMAELVEHASRPDTRIMAGGTDIIPAMKHQLIKPKNIVDLSGVTKLRKIWTTSKSLHIGANCTLSQISKNNFVTSKCYGLLKACESVGTRTIANMATVGGNIMLETRCSWYNRSKTWRDTIGGCLKCDGTICHVAPSGTGCYAAHSGDLPPVLWQMGAELIFESQQGPRRISLPSMFRPNDGRAWNLIAPGEVLTEIVVPLNTPPVGFYKVRKRGSIDFGSVTAAVRLSSQSATAVVSGVSPSPVFVSAPSAQDMPQIAWEQVKPLPTHVDNTAWRHEMVRVAVARAIRFLA